ncbi:MAG: GNAT family N-acetyltransferase [Geminicoccaceae bacterium]
MLGLPRPAAISVRNVGPFDLGRLSRLHRACFEEAWNRADLAHLLALPGGFGLIARVYDGGLAGLDGMRGVGFSLCRLVQDEAELLSIGVAPAYRKRGIGRALLRASMDRCLSGGATVMFLEVAIDNHGAQQLYAENGFERVGSRPDYYQRADGSRMSAHTMRCELLRAQGSRSAAGPEPRLSDA